MSALLKSLLALGILVAACNPSSVGNGSPASPASPVSLGVNTLQAPTEAELKQVQDSGLVDANTRFGWALFQQILSEKPVANHFISPLSLSIALGMVLNGAAGETRQEMARILHLEGMDLQEINQAQLTLRKRLVNQGSGVRVDLANALWVKKGITFNPNFLKTNQDYFNARTTALDFADPLSVQTINAWASENTQGRIPRVIGQIDPMTLMILMNAIYFKGSWSTPFDKAQTQPRDFKTGEGKTVQTPMMRHYGKFRYLRDSENQFQAVALPYGKEKSVQMFVFLPDPESSPVALLKKIEASRLNDWLLKLRSQEGEVLLPRFKLEYEVTLNDTLKALGMKQAFEAEKANFSDLIATEQAFISQVKQNSFVEVNEEGTEAAAVTTVVVSATSVQLPQEPFSFVADRPFVYLIYDQTTRSILFMGVLNSPS